jgi:hypothetical protein
MPILDYQFTTEFRDFTALVNQDKFLTVFASKNQQRLHLFLGNLKNDQFGDEHQVQLPDDTFYNCFKFENNSLYGLQTIGEDKQNPTGIGYWELSLRRKRCMGPSRVFKFSLDKKIKLNNFKVGF